MDISTGSKKSVRHKDFTFVIFMAEFLSSTPYSLNYVETLWKGEAAHQVQWSGAKQSQDLLLESMHQRLISFARRP